MRQKRTCHSVLPKVLAAGPAMDGIAYLLATCLLPVVGFSHCSLAKYQGLILGYECLALHAVKALHALQVLHGDIRERTYLSQNKPAKLYS